MNQKVKQEKSVGEVMEKSKLLPIASRNEKYTIT
jgi:hypothetical protein